MFECLGVIFLIAIALLIGLLVFVFRIGDADLTLLYYDLFGNNLDNLKRKVVWITGASSGIGEELAYQLASANCRLVLSARRVAELERVKQVCVAKGQLSENDVLVLPFDVTRTETHQSALNQVLDHFKQLDILVHNAGRSQRASWENIELEVDKQMFDLIVFGPVHLSRLAVKQFQKQGGGHIAVVTSSAGKTGIPGSGSYNGAKYALHGYFECLRIEKGQSDNIDVTLIAPGLIGTPFLPNSFTDKPNEVFGEVHDSYAGRMSAERCARLCAVAIANRLDEVWISLSPFMVLLYGSQYLPTVTRTIMRKMGFKMMLGVRDGKQTIKTQTKND